MTTASPRRRRKQPYNPALAEYQAKVQAEEDAKKRDRKSRDLLRNARVAPIEIQNPEGEAGEKIIVFRSTRNDPVADMHARGHLTDCEYATCRHWERAYEDSEIGGVGAIDPSKEAVGGGRIREVLTERQRKAVLELRKSRDTLGEVGTYLIIQVLGTKMTLLQVAQQRCGGVASEIEYKFTRRRFHECLETLGVLFGYVAGTRA